MSDMRLLVKPSGLYTYPDLMVVCGKPEFAPGRVDTLTNPVLIAEVLSESTRDYDRTRKFALYRPLPTLRDYLLIDQSRLYLECLHRDERGQWVFDAYDQPEDTLVIPSLEVEIALAEVYDKVEWPE